MEMVVFVLSLVRHARMVNANVQKLTTLKIRRNVLFVLIQKQHNILKIQVDVCVLKIDSLIENNAKYVQIMQ